MASCISIPQMGYRQQIVLTEVGIEPWEGLEIE